MPKTYRTVVAVPADQQNGSSVGLPPSDKPWELEEGSDYAPSDEQKIIFQQWKECWHRVHQLRQQVRGTRLIIVNNGDAIDGNHHRTTQISSAKASEQIRMHIAAMDWALDHVKFGGRDRIYYIEGTEAHAGPGHEHEETIARHFESVPYRKAKKFSRGKALDGRCLWPFLDLEVNGIPFRIQHHGGSIGRRTWTRPNGMNLLAADTYWKCLDLDLTIPRYVVYSHLHRYVSGRYVGNRRTVENFITPGFQGHTHHTKKLSNDYPDIGMLIFVVEENGDSRYEVVKTTFTYSDKVERV